MMVYASSPRTKMFEKSRQRFDPADLNRLPCDSHADVMLEDDRSMSHTSHHPDLTGGPHKGNNSVTYPKDHFAMISTSLLDDVASLYLATLPPSQFLDLAVL